MFYHILHKVRLHLFAKHSMSMKEQTSIWLNTCNTILQFNENKEERTRYLALEYRITMSRQARKRF